MVLKHPLLACFPNDPIADLGKHPMLESFRLGCLEEASFIEGDIDCKGLRVGKFVIHLLLGDLQKK
ncbi:hypothetical protein SCOCK_20158 [Actinacidiphila cocklensis]|uniref:Uncharacterized protein n=1 Tax=Actinacidiphila cocklensis TaxID=887465 RepID=A0A9W4DN33_9ACTN|nr:hypothetical protein SCOCK_20158 [Actinacidiphila cocklensis]